VNTSVISPPAASAAPPRTKQPVGLLVLFLAEMWERFSFYGMRALLVLYLVHAFKYSDEDAQHLYGVYGGLVYLTPVIGGWLADRFLGARVAAIIGGCTMMIGHFAMAFPSMLGLALGCLIVGNGFFKPNTTTMVGMLYPDRDDPRRDAGYTLFYVGINLGAFIGPFVAGGLASWAVPEGSPPLHWHWGFASAGVGMGLGLINFLWMQRYLDRVGLREGRLSIGWSDMPTILAWLAGCVAFVWATLQAWTVIGPILEPVPVTLRLVIVAVVAGAIVYVRHAMHRDPNEVPLTGLERRRIAGLLIMVVLVSFFWLGFEQAGGSMNLFADAQTDRHIAGPGSWEIPAAWFQSVNPGIILIFGPLLAALWTRWNTSRYAISDTAKQGLGMVVLGLGFIVLAVAQDRAAMFGKVGPWWLVGVYFLHTMGELMASPVGLAMVSRLAPARMSSFMMGIWFLSSAVAQYYAGDLASLLKPYGIRPYVFLIGSSIGAGVLLLLVTPLLNRMMGVHTYRGAPAGTGEPVPST
jgi:POT family proton-dependent oligopeptide transporter